jgi:hypothetical protein
VTAGPASGPAVERFVGVYDADHTVIGELSYFVKARFGAAHCSLCDITHGLVREKAAWRDCRAGLGVAFDTHHRDDRPDDVRAASGGVAPVVLAEAGGELVVLLGPDELEACAGSIDALVSALQAAVERQGWAWPSGVGRG